MKLKPFNWFKMCLGAIIVTAPIAQGFGAQSIWLGTGTTPYDLFEADNWAPSGVPVLTGDTFFLGSGTTTTPPNGLTPLVTASGHTFGSITFGGANQYQIGFNGGYTFTIDGGTVYNGVQNTMDEVQTFNINQTSSVLNFTNSASANLTSDAEIDYVVTNGGELRFGVSEGTDTATAGYSTLFVDGTLSAINFYADTDAGNSFITAGATGPGGLVAFYDNSNPLNAGITADGTALILFNTTNSATSAPNITLHDTAQLSVYQSNNVATLNSDSTTTIVQLFDNNNNPTSLETNEPSDTCDEYDGQITGVLKNNVRSLLIKDGDGALVLTLPMPASAPYIWDARVEDGALVGNSTNLNRNVIIYSDGVAVFDQTSDVGDGVLDYATDQLTGTGLLVKAGDAKLNITSTNSNFGGDTLIGLGNLAINAPFGNGSGTVVVDIDGTLSGVGPITDNVVVNGTISPGNSIDTMVIIGDIEINSNSTYYAEVDGNGDSDLIAVDGSATINGGIVDVSSPDGTFLIDVPYTILFATDGVTGPGYNGANQDINQYLIAELSYGPNDVEVTLNTNFEAFADTENQFQVALQLDSIDDPSDCLQDVLQNLVLLPQNGLNHALDQLSGEQYTSLIQIAQTSNRRFLRDLYLPLLFGIPVSYEDCCDKDKECCDWSFCDDVEIWQTVHYGRSLQKGSHEARGYKSNHIDVALGLQTDINDCWKAGIAGFYEFDRVHYNLKGRSRANVVRAALYGIYQSDCFYGLADAVFGYNHFDVKRDIEFIEIEHKPHSDPKVYDGTLYVEAGFNYCVTECLQLQPFFGVEGGYYWHNHFREKGGECLNLRAKSRHLWACDSRLGVRATANFDCDLVVSADIAWQHWYTKDDNKIHLRFEDFGFGFHIKGPKQQRDVVDGSLYIGKTFCEDFTLFARALGERSENFSFYSAEIGFDFKL